MAKKALIAIAVAVVILVIFPIAWYHWQNSRPAQPSGDDLTNQTSGLINDMAIYPDFDVYRNTKFSYSINYPNDWFLGFYGESEEQAQVVFFVSDKGDLQAGDGGLPLGAKAEIIVQNLREFKEMDQSMSHIDTIGEYVEWQNTYQAGFDAEMQGDCVEENIKIGQADAIKEICDNPVEAEFGKIRKVKLLSPDMNYVYIIQYLGREPHYSDNTDKFDKIYKSLNL